MVSPGREHLRDAGPDQVHVHGQGGGRRRRCQPPLALCRRCEPKPQAAVGLRNKQFQVTGGGELPEVLMEEGVIAVVAGGTPADPFQQGLGQYVFGRHVRGWLSSS